MLTKTKLASLTLSLVLACAFIAQPALAEGDADRGELLAYTCLGCHGIDGYRNAYPSYRVPKLGGQKAAYIVTAVRGYRDGTRKHPTMQAHAGSLSDQDIEDVAAYLATLGTATVEAGGSDAAALAAAETCVACHGQNGISVNPLWPTLAGQHEDYLEQSMNQYRNGQRSDVTMAAMAAQISDSDVALLARYYSRLEGLETTKAE